jgi:hypothetical protein
MYRHQSDSSESTKGQFHTTVSMPDEERIKINVMTENMLDFISA